MITKIINWIISYLKGELGHPAHPTSPEIDPQRTEIPKVVISPTPVIQTPPSGDLLEVMCQAIKSREGYASPSEQYPQGTPAWKNNNPGNLRYRGQIGTVGHDERGFAKFTTYDAGYSALKNQILFVAKGKSGAYPNPCDIKNFFRVYSPSTDGNDPSSYANEVAGKMGVAISWELSNLV